MPIDRGTPGRAERIDSKAVWVARSSSTAELSDDDARILALLQLCRRILTVQRTLVGVISQFKLDLLALVSVCRTCLNLAAFGGKIAASQHRSIAACCDDDAFAQGLLMEKMHFSRMDQGTDEDFEVLKHVHERTLNDLPDRLLQFLKDIGNDTAYNISRYDHCLQTATRALRDGKDEEYVVVALLHDACEPLGPFNHGEVIAAILRPFISRDNCWMLAKHGLFQTYFYASHLGLDPNARDQFKSDSAYERTVEFCAKYDEVSFDPDYRNEPLSTFEPMVRRLLRREWTPPK